jgi:hypothetical protein
LLSIADQAGEDWRERARSAALLLMPSPENDGDISTMLLRDLQTVFAPHDPTLASEFIVNRFWDMEDHGWFHEVFAAYFPKPPRWTLQIRPLIDTAKPATTGVASETGQDLIPSLVANPSALSCASSAVRT